MVIIRQEQTIFKKVGLSERKMIFRELASEKMQIMVKGSEDDEVFHLIALQTEKDETLLCRRPTDSKQVLKDQKVSGSFSFRNERYYFHSDMSLQSDWIVLKINVDIFQLQRRANARINLPESYDGLFIVTQHQGKSYFVECRLKDISAGGFKMELLGDTLLLSIGEIVKGSLRLGKRRPIDFEVEVRFIKRIEQDGKVTQIAGMQFLNRDYFIENRLLLLMMDLQRELYLKYSSRGSL